MRFCHLSAIRCTDLQLSPWVQPSRGKFIFLTLKKFILHRRYLLGGLLIPLCLSACDTPINNTNEKLAGTVRKTEPIGVKTISIKQDQSPAIFKRFSGLVKPIRSSDLSFSQAGKVSGVFIDVGSSVKQGEVLSRLDIEPLKKKKFTLQSQFTATQADLNSLYQQKTGQSSAQIVVKINQLRSDLDRIETDLKNSNPSSNELRNLNRRLQTNEKQIQTLTQKSHQQKITELKSQINDLKGQIQEVDATIAASNVTAPFNGVILEKMIEPGSIISPGRIVLKVANLDAYRIWVRLPTELAANLKPGEEVPFEHGEQQIFGQVILISPTVDPLTQTRMVVLQPRDAQTKDSFIVGERMDVLFPTLQQKTGYWLPISALMKEIDGVWSIYLVKRIDGKPTIVRQYVEVIDVDNNQALVRGDLTEGMSIVEQGLHRIVPGQVVRLANQKTPESKAKQKPEQVPSI